MRGEGWHKPVRTIEEALSRREREVLVLAACGLSSQETAGLRGCSVTTVKTQRRDASAKLFARSVTHALAVAVVRGEITREELAAAMEKLSL